MKITGSVSQASRKLKLDHCTNKVKLKENIIETETWWEYGLFYKLILNLFNRVLHWRDEALPSLCFLPDGVCKPQSGN